MRRERARIDARLDLGDEVRPQLAREREALVRLADARHRSVDEHQLEVLRLLTAEFVEAPENAADALQRVDPGELRVEAGLVGHVQQAESFFRERIKDVVLAGKVAVDGRRTVFDFFRDFANRDVAITLGHEELARCVEDGAAHRFAIAFLPFFDAHAVDPTLNSVQ